MPGVFAYFPLTHFRVLTQDRRDLPLGIKCTFLERSNGGSLKVDNPRHSTAFIGLFMHDDVQQTNETGSTETHHNIRKPSSRIEKGFIGVSSCPWIWISPRWRSKNQEPFKVHVLLVQDELQLPLRPLHQILKKRRSSDDIGNGVHWQQVRSTLWRAYKGISIPLENLKHGFYQKNHQNLPKCDSC